MADVLVLGAEAQAATSIACAYPERTVTFVSDDAILDGSDLPNVRMQFAKPTDREMLTRAAGQQLVPLCPRWLAQEAALPLSRVFEKLEHHTPAICFRSVIARALTDAGYSKAIVGIAPMFPSRARCSNWRT